MSRNTIARINLESVSRNLSRIRRLASSSAIVGVVKADAYGHGFSHICSALNGTDVLAVATVGEGVRCREAGWSGRLLLLEGPSNVAEFEEMVTLDAEMVVHHSSQLKLLQQRARDVRRPLWLKIDTGMHRLGFPVTESRAVFSELQKIYSKSPVVLMTHFACADDPSNPMTLEQIEVFDAATSELRGPASLANSAGLLNFRKSQRDYVRPGIMLYGISPCQKKSASDIGLSPAMTLQCELIAVNQAQSGDTVGYGANYTCDRDTRIGVAAIGYGDGYPRHAKNGTPVLVNGRRSKLIGNVSMDMITLDLNDHPDARVGDVVTLWGDGLPIEEVAPWADAIPYQLICGVTARVRYEVG